MQNDKNALKCLEEMIVSHCLGLNFDRMIY